MSFNRDSVVVKSTTDKTFFKKVKPFGTILLFIACFFLLDHCIGSVLENYRDSKDFDHNSLMWNDFYEQQKNSSDVIFIGSSHAKFAFNTKLLNEGLKVKTFNLSTPDQTPVMGYYALKEALRYQTPKLVVYEAYWRKFGTNDNTTPAYFIYDYIKSADIKADILVHLTDSKEYFGFLQQALCKTYKYRNYAVPFIKDLAKGKVNLFNNNKAIIKRPVDLGEDGIYYQDGYFGSNRIANDDLLYHNNPFQKYTYFEWKDQQIRFFKKTLKLCQEKNIKVILITAPMPDVSIGFVEKYAEYSGEFMKISREYQIEYKDYNLENKKTKAFNKGDFMDSNHLNSKGAEKLGRMLIGLIRKYL